MTTPNSSLFLNEYATVALNGSGNGTAQLGPGGPNEHWLPTVVSVKVSSNTNEATCAIYIGEKVADANFVDLSFTASTGDSSGNVAGYDMSKRSNPTLFAVWSGGDAGATGTVILSGTKEIR